MLMAASTVSAADAPAPSPTSDATTLFVPTVIASFVALAFGLFFSKFMIYILMYIDSSHYNFYMLIWILVRLCNIIVIFVMYG